MNRYIVEDGGGGAEQAFNVLYRCFCLLFLTNLRKSLVSSVYKTPFIGLSCLYYMKITLN